MRMSRGLGDVYNSQIVFPAIQHRLIVFADRLIDRIEPVLIRLQLIDIGICDIVLALQIFTDDPLTQR